MLKPLWEEGARYKRRRSDGEQNKTFTQGNTARGCDEQNLLPESAPPLGLAEPPGAVKRKQSHTSKRALKRLEQKSIRKSAENGISGKRATSARDHDKEPWERT